MLAIRIKARYAEEVRKALLRRDVVDNERRVVKGKGFVEIPVLTEDLRLNGFEYELVQQEKPIYSRPKLNFETVKTALRRDLGEEAESLKGGWEVIGDILIVELPERLEDKKYLIGEKLMGFFPRVKSVVNRRGIRGTERRPQVEVIAGEGTQTVHKEHYCLFKLDVAKVMFSAGNIEERRRMAFISDSDETVLDMFAGIGQFTIPIAKHSNPRRIYAVEKNPVAYGFLKENIQLNGLENVEPILGDCRELSPKGEVDRVIMGYFFNPRDFLPTAVEALKCGGVIHYHDLAMKKEIPQRAEEIKGLIRKLGYDPVVLGKRIVKSYAPAKWHVVFDVKI
jgi:tRNA wybutosine-synthesizing protein 2